MLDDGEFGEDFGVVHFEHALVCSGVSHHQASCKIFGKKKAEKVGVCVAIGVSELLC